MGRKTEMSTRLDLRLCCGVAAGGRCQGRRASESFTSSVDLNASPKWRQDHIIRSFPSAFSAPFRHIPRDTPPSVAASLSSSESINQNSFNDVTLGAPAVSHIADHKSHKSFLPLSTLQPRRTVNDCLFDIYSHCSATQIFPKCKKRGARDS
jgi:hypothetical protein